jgi:hypothetical protein
MNIENRMKWEKVKFVPSLPPQSAVVIDSGPYDWLVGLFLLLPLGA